MIDVIIWSMDRAAQLDLLLRSITQHDRLCNNVSIIYRSSNSDFAAGYNALTAKYMGGDLIFIPERNFKNDILRVVSGSKGNYILGISDDSLFINTFDIWPGLEDFEVAYSLRLHPGINHCQPAGLDINPPDFAKTLPGMDGFLRWNWKLMDPRGCWGYPNPCDSNIYKREYFLRLLVNGKFHNPGTMEAWMNFHRPANMPIMVCSDIPCMINICTNRVQDTSQCPHGKHTAKKLNDMFLNNKRIKTPVFNVNTLHRCHVDYDLEFEDA